MTRSVLWCALVSAFAASTSAVAAGPAFTVKDGVMQFPNVVVVNTPMQATEAPSQAGFKAYIDANGALRAPTPEELQAEAAAPASNASTLRRAAVVRVAPQAQTAEDGTVSLTLDDSSLLYSVMVRQDDGTLTEVCVPGTQAADIVAGKIDVKALAHKEVDHDR